MTTATTKGTFVVGHKYQESEIIDMDRDLFRKLAFDYQWRPGDAPVALRRAANALFKQHEVDGSLLNAARG